MSNFCCIILLRTFFSIAQLTAVHYSKTKKCYEMSIYIHHIKEGPLFL